MQIKFKKKILQNSGSSCGLLFEEDAMLETAVKGEAEELGVELMDTEAAHLSLVLEESQVKVRCLKLL